MSTTLLSFPNLDAVLKLDMVVYICGTLSNIVSQGFHENGTPIGASSIRINRWMWFVLFPSYSTSSSATAAYELLGSLSLNPRLI